MKLTFILSKESISYLILEFSLTKKGRSDGGGGIFIDFTNKILIKNEIFHIIIYLVKARSYVLDIIDCSFQQPQQQLKFHNLID
jgi:hypothetical protein